MIPYLSITLLLISIPVHEAGHYLYALLFVKRLSRPRFFIDKLLNPTVSVRPDRDYYDLHPKEYLVSFVNFSMVGFVVAVVFLVAVSSYLNMPLYLLVGVSAIASLYDFERIPAHILRYRRMVKDK